MAIAFGGSLGTNNPADGTTGSFTTAATVPSGGFIVVVGGHFLDSPALSSVSGGGLTWTIDAQGQNPSGSGDYIAVASAQAPSGLASGTTITATWASSAQAQLIGGMSFTGVLDSSPVDAVGTVQGVTTGTAWTTGNVTVDAGSVLVGTAYSESEGTGSTITAPSIEALYWDDPTFNYGQTAGYRIEPSGGSVAVAGTWDTTTSGAVAVGVAYLEAPVEPPDIDPDYSRFPKYKLRRN